MTAVMVPGVFESLSNNLSILVLQLWGSTCMFCACHVDMTNFMKVFCYLYMVRKSNSTCERLLEGCRILSVWSWIRVKVWCSRNLVFVLEGFVDGIKRCEIKAIFLWRKRKRYSFETRTGPEGQPGTGPSLSKNPLGSWPGETWSTWRVDQEPGRPR